MDIDWAGLACRIFLVFCVLGIFAVIAMEIQKPSEHAFCERRNAVLEDTGRIGKCTIVICRGENITEYKFCGDGDTTTVPIFVGRY